MQPQDTNPAPKKAATPAKQYGCLESLGMILIAFVGLGIYLWFTDTPEEAEPQSQTAQQGLFAVEIKASAHVDGGKVAVTGKTNLPDGAKLMVKLFCEPLKYSAADDAIVQGGSFQVPEFSLKGAQLPEGEYTLRVFLTPLGQPESVAAIIGQKGEMLVGQVVEKSPSIAGLNVVRLETLVAVKGSNAAEYTRQLKETAGAYRSEIQALYSELMEFKNSEQFLQFGFSPNGFPEWKKRAEALRDGESPDFESKSTAITVLSLGLKYVFSKSEENDYTLDCHSKIKKYLGRP